MPSSNQCIVLARFVIVFLGVSVATAAANEANKCVGFETTSDTRFVVNNCTHGISVKFDPIPPDTVGGMIDIKAEGKQTMDYTFDVHTHPRFHACFQPRVWYNGRCYQMGETSQYKEIKRPSQSEKIARNDAGFCQLFYEQEDQVSCRTECSYSKSDCDWYRYEFLPKLQADGHAASSVSSGYKRTSSSKTCGPGQVLFDCKDENTFFSRCFSASGTHVGCIPHS
jgi:hypothetical protein